MLDYNYACGYSIKMFGWVIHHQVIFDNPRWQYEVYELFKIIREAFRISTR